MRHTLIGLGLIATGLLSAQNRSISFDHSLLKDLKAKAQKENKLIFIDAFTTWCGPCKQMARNVFTNDTAADYYNANFINAKIDMEKGEGIEIAKLYEVGCYPTLLFIDGNGNLVHRESGSMPVQAFVSLGKTAKDDSRNYSYYVKNYEARKGDAAFLADYIDVKAATCLDPSRELSSYFALQSEQDLWSETNWRMISNYVSDLNSREFRFLVSNRAKLSASHGEAAINDKINEVAAGSLRTAIRSTPFDQAAYDQAKKTVSGLGIPDSKKLLFESDLRLAKHRKDWKAYADLAMANGSVYYLDNADELNNLAWDLYENSSDKNVLQQAEAWSKRSVELEASYPLLDTYASLLYKNGKKQEALATAEKAIEYAKKENYTPEEYKPTSELIKQIKVMK